VRRRLKDMFLTVVADTLADLAGILQEVRAESGADVQHEAGIRRPSHKPSPVRPTTRHPKGRRRSARLPRAMTR
jgi:hypothetical protein